MSASTKLKRGLALALAGGSLAIGVPAALAGSGGGDAAPGTSEPASSFIQNERDRDRDRSDRYDCPERDGEQPGGGSQGSSTPEPSV